MLRGKRMTYEQCFEEAVKHCRTVAGALDMAQELYYYHNPDKRPVDVCPCCNQEIP